MGPKTHRLILHFVLSFISLLDLEIALNRLPLAREDSTAIRNRYFEVELYRFVCSIFIKQRNHELLLP
jgi:hypothetical protein